MDGVGYRRKSRVWLAYIPEGFGEDERARCRICDEVVPPITEGIKEKCTAAKLWRHLSEHPEVATMLAGIDQDDIMKEGVMENYNLSVIQKKRSKGFTSKVWKFFMLDDIDKDMSICFECGDRVYRGRDRNTTSMWNHVKEKHPEQYDTAQKEEQDEDSGPLAVGKEAVKDQFLLYSTRQNSYICKTCGTIMRLESPDEEINTSRLMKHLDNIFHKRVQHGLEPPKRPILPKYYANTRKAEKKKQPAKVKTARPPKKVFPNPALVEEIAGYREVDFIHSAMVMKTMYAQQKRDICCDCTIIIPHKQQLSGYDTKAIPGLEKGTIEYYKTNVGSEFKVHSSVMAVVSEKIRAILENDKPPTITFNAISIESMQRIIEIAYLGKLKDLMTLKDSELTNLYVAAHAIGATSVAQYIERSCSSIAGKSSVDSPANGKIVGTAEQPEASGSMMFGNHEPVISMAPTSENHSPPVTSSTTEKKSSSSRRKRRPLSTTFRLKVPKVDEDSSDPDHSAGNELQPYNGDNDGSPMESGMKFEIQGDTAILRASIEELD